MSRILLAPMEGMVDEVMRDVLTRAAGYDWCVAEFARISASVPPARFFRRIAPELDSGSQTPSGTPVRVQLLGSDPLRLARGAALLAGLQPAGIDLNFGCPAPMVNRHGGGASLLEDPDLIGRIVREVAHAIDGRVPLSAKMRLGIRDTSRACEIARTIAGNGVGLLVVHARTRDEGYRPPAHWGLIREIVAAVDIPVVANGEIWQVGDYRRCLAESGCQDVMLGRGAVADPFLADRIRGVVTEIPSDDDWLRLRPLIGACWDGIRNKVAPRHAPGRLKQWLNLLRRTYPQAEDLFRTLRVSRLCTEVSSALQAAGAL